MKMTLWQRVCAWRIRSLKRRIARHLAAADQLERQRAQWIRRFYRHVLEWRP